MPQSSEVLLEFAARLGLRRLSDIALRGGQLPLAAVVRHLPRPLCVSVKGSGLSLRVGAVRVLLRGERRGLGASFWAGGGAVVLGRGSLVVKGAGLRGGLGQDFGHAQVDVSSVGRGDRGHCGGPGCRHCSGEQSIFVSPTML